MGGRVVVGEYYRSVADMPADLVRRLEQYAWRYGENYDSCLATEPDREVFWCRGRLGAVSFGRWASRYVLAVGGLLAPEEHRMTLLKDFLRFAKSNRLHLSFYNIGSDALQPFRVLGFQISKNGEEPIIRLDQTSWQGKEYEWVRRQESFCKRRGLTLLEAAPDPDDPTYRDQIRPELEAISREHIASTLHGFELRHFVGRFNAMSLRPRRLFVVRSDWRIEAFVVCNPCLAGRGWAIEMYRRREDAVRGAIPFAMLQTMRRLKEEGTTYCSLSLIPALRCGQPMEGDSRVCRTVFVFWWQRLNWIFDMQGIYHFKSRFRPEYRETYIAALPRVTLMSMLALGMKWGLLLVPPWRLLRHGVRKLNLRRLRGTMAAPEHQAARVHHRVDPAAPSSLRQEGDGVSKDCNLSRGRGSKDERNGEP